jgi:hypothetical protein
MISNVLVMHVLNGAWDLKIERDGSVSNPHGKEGYDFLGFIWGKVDWQGGYGVDYEDALRRFEEGERGDPAMCSHCLGTGKVPLDPLRALTPVAAG